MPRTLQLRARFAGTFYLDEHAAAMLAPAQMVGRKMHQRCKRRQRRGQLQAHHPGASRQRAMQYLRYRACTHPDAFRVGPQVRQRTKVGYIDQREHRVVQGQAARRCNGVTHMLGERMADGGLAVALQRDGLTGIAGDCANYVFTDPSIGRRRDAAADGVHAHHIGRQVADDRRGKHGKTGDAGEHVRLAARAASSTARTPATRIRPIGKVEIVHTPTDAGFDDAVPFGTIGLEGSARIHEDVGPKRSELSGGRHRDRTPRQ